MCIRDRAMGTLANGADVLTPNLTEAAIILGREWQGADVDEPTAVSYTHLDVYKRQQLTYPRSKNGLLELMLTGIAYACPTPSPSRPSC